MLLAGSGSVSFAVTVAVLLNPPAAVGLTLISRTAFSPSFISPILQVTMLPEREQPEEAENKINVCRQSIDQDNTGGIRRAEVPDSDPVGELTTNFHWVRVVFFGDREVHLRFLLAKG